nr:DUF2254 domain-containing protein [uncultured Allomuricauda sp.]
MIIPLSKWIRIYYNKVKGSIASVPGIIVFVFLLLIWIMLTVDFSEWGQNLKTDFSWLRIRDASTARSLVSTVAAAIISLTVFSFSMVMIVLNQAASQMSNRVLNRMTENRFQQLILGFYIGTIVYALLLLSTIRDNSSGITVPSLSIYLLIILTIINVFLFIYFLDYVTKTVRYETIISRLQKKAMESMKVKFEQNKTERPNWEKLPKVELKSPVSNYFQSFDEKKLLQLASEHSVHVNFLFRPTTYIIKDTVFLEIYGKESLEDENITNMLSTIDFYDGQPIDRNSDYGFTQLSEVAIKALSPGINDPGTAVLALHALSDLFYFKMTHKLPETIHDDEGTPRIYRPSSTFEDLFEKCILPIWNYGKNDKYIQDELSFLLAQLKTLDRERKHINLFDGILEKIAQHTEG